MTKVIASLLALVTALACLVSCQPSDTGDCDKNNDIVLTQRVKHLDSYDEAMALLDTLIEKEKLSGKAYTLNYSGDEYKVVYRFVSITSSTYDYPFTVDTFANDYRMQDVSVATCILLNGIQCEDCDIHRDFALSSDMLKLENFSHSLDVDNLPAMATILPIMTKTYEEPVITNPELLEFEQTNLCSDPEYIYRAYHYDVTYEGERVFTLSCCIELSESVKAMIRESVAQHG